jgi:signal transduction histidine kinase
LSLNLRLVALVVALLAAVIGGIAVISTRVAHVEIRKVVTTSELLHARLPPGQTLRDFFERMKAREPGESLAVFDADLRLVAATLPLTRAVVDAGGKLTFDVGPAHLVVRGPQMVVHDAGGRVIGTVYHLPSANDAETPLPVAPTRALDRSFTWIFTGAALFGVVMAVLIARLVTGPIARLTAAAQRMGSGDFAVRVAPGGGPELAGLASAFNAMAAALDRNEELRRRMVSDVAHELRAPLTNIRCELESMQDGLTALTAERIDSMHQEVMQLAHVVDDLQDLALAEAGKLEMHPQRVALAPLVRRAHSAADGPDDLMVVADPRRVVQILTNLLTNAQRYAENVRVVWRRDGEHALVQVIDDGTGIPAGELPRVFDRFYRLDAARGRHTGGAGLGLSIVQQLVAAQGGRVWAESEVGKGSTFSFTLPLAS